MAAINLCFLNLKGLIACQELSPSLVSALRYSHSYNYNDLQYITMPISMVIY